VEEKRTVNRQSTILLSISILLMLYCEPGVLAQSKSERELRGYRGAVKSVRTEVVEYSYESKKVKVGKRRLDFAENFDRIGNLIRETMYGYDGDVLFDETNVYQNGRMIETLRKNSPFSVLPDKVVYIYNASGNIVEENGYDLSGKLVSNDIYEYDGRKRKIQWTSKSFFEHEDHRPHRWTYSYDDQNRVKEEKAFLEGGTGFVATDELGGPHRKLNMYRDETRSGLTIMFPSGGAFSGSRLSSYDKKGNEMEDIEFDEAGNLKSKTQYAYVFDGLGNWTIQKTFEWDKGDGRYQLTKITYQTFTF